MIANVFRLLFFFCSLRNGWGMSEVLNEIITLNQFGLSRSFREALGKNNKNSLKMGFYWVGAMNSNMQGICLICFTLF